MRLAMFDVMDSTTNLLEKRREFYQQCAYELQELIRNALLGDTLLNVSARIKRGDSLREKMLRKRLYLEYDNPYDLLNNLSDLIGLRAECRFLRDEQQLYEKLNFACTLVHEDGTRSVPTHPNVRFDLRGAQPQTQQNGLSIYRIDGKYHKNGVSAPFELQLKALVHTFWAEIEHQLIYKNNAYLTMDDFTKKLLYSNFDSLKLVDSSLQLIYDQLETRTGVMDAERRANFRPVLAKTLSDMYLHHMERQVGFTVRIDHICNILADYLLQRVISSGDPLHMLFDRVRNALEEPPSFDETLELDEPYDPDDEFCARVGGHILQRLNADYDWNLMFRILFSIEGGSRTRAFSEFMLMYRDRYAKDQLYEAVVEAERENVQQITLNALADVLIEQSGIAVFYEQTQSRLEQAICEACGQGCTGQKDMKAYLVMALE